MATFRTLLDNVKTLYVGKDRSSSQTRIIGSRRDLLDKREQIFSIDRRRSLVPLVNKHKGIIQQRFPGVNMKDVVDSVELMFKKSLNKYVDGKKYRWVNASRTEIFAPNYRQVQNLIRDVKFDIRTQAMASINKTSRKLKSKDLDIATALVLTGNDMRPQEEGGDIIREDLANGVLVGTKRLTKIANDNKTGFQIGHTFGPGVANITSFTGVKHDSDIIHFFSPDIQAEFRGMRKRAIKLDAKLVTDINIFNKSGRAAGTITVTMAQSLRENRAGTDELNALTRRLKKILESEFPNILRHYTSSPSIINRIIFGIKELFTKGRISSTISRLKKTYKSKGTIFENTPVYGPSLRISKSRTGKIERTNETDIHKIIALLNEKLHDQIQKNMGKGESKQVLNYRTGRFAKSAEITGLFPGSEKGTMLARVKYMKNPYDTFEKGGRLYKPLRDPKGIFGRSIRQLLQEQKIVTLRRVMVNTHG